MNENGLNQAKMHYYFRLKWVIASKRPLPLYIFCAPCAAHGPALTQVNTPNLFFSFCLDTTHESQGWAPLTDPAAWGSGTPPHQSWCLGQPCPKWKHGRQARERRRDAQAENPDDLRGSRSDVRELETRGQERAERRSRVPQRTRQLRAGARDGQEQRGWP